LHRLWLFLEDFWNFLRNHSFETRAEIMNALKVNNFVRFGTLLIRFKWLFVHLDRNSPFSWLDETEIQFISFLVCPSRCLLAICAF